jgi:ammonium transporter, Amt family
MPGSWRLQPLSVCRAFQASILYGGLVKKKWAINSALSLNKLQTSALMKKADDTLDVFSTHGVAGLMGGLLNGVLANPDMLLYIGTDKDAPGVNATGWLYGNSRSSNCRRMPRVISSCLTRSRTFVILKIIASFFSLRMDARMLEIGDMAVHGEEA